MRWFFAAMLMLSCAMFAKADPVFSVEDSQIRQPMPGRTVTAGYLTLYNRSAEAAKLVAASSSQFARVELHQHTHKDGMMRMEQISEINIDAGGSVAFEPGGLHLMLFEPTDTLEIGQQIPLTLEFADGQQLMLTVPVVATPKR
ncbi:copper chaperone PCu(A)C [Rheinheimera oceanensis]|uniref:copper chaperone PCu(A)C n=1 Tax=Rheinheimera oceanensis TaxID=2817449 RepID=UPI001BFE4234|nr:copper chaperone PCu(A)C [Rheinheimera oceanensis]